MGGPNSQNEYSKETKSAIKLCMLDKSSVFYTELLLTWLNKMKGAKSC